MKIKMLMIPWLSLLMPMAEAAISVSHEDTTLSFGLRVQSRIELADAKNTDGFLLFLFCIAVNLCLCLDIKR